MVVVFSSSEQHLFAKFNSELIEAGAGSLKLEAGPSI